MKKVLLILLMICSCICYASCAKVRTIRYDIDRDGVKERCSLDYGATGVFTVIFTAESKGEIKYQRLIPFIHYGDVYFDKVDGDVKLCYRTNETHYYDISVNEDGAIHLSENRKQAEYAD